MKLGFGVFPDVEGRLVAQMTTVLFHIDGPEVLKKRGHRLEDTNWIRTMKIRRSGSAFL